MDRLDKDELAHWLRGRAAEGLGVIVATHDVELAAELADRVVLMADGTVIADGPPTQLLSGGWYFSTETARITGGRAVLPAAGAALIDELARAAS
jgi:energy-coupling factor transport system ATP-binding protein